MKKDNEPTDVDAAIVAPDSGIIEDSGIIDDTSLGDEDSGVVDMKGDEEWGLAVTAHSGNEPTIRNFGLGVRCAMQ